MTRTEGRNLRPIKNSENRDFFTAAKGPYCCFYDTPMGLRFLQIIDWYEYWQDNTRKRELRLFSDTYWGEAPKHLEDN